MNIRGLGSSVRLAVLIGLAGCLAASAARAELRMPKIFTDHMVLQQQMPVAVWGWADPGQKVTVSILTASQSAIADANGKWRLEIPALKAAMTADKPAALVIASGKDKIELKDVLIGEVWVAGGQSNMNRPVSNDAFAAANYPTIRLFTTNGSIPRKDTLNDTVSWVPCTPETIATCGDIIGPNKRRPFSEVGYHFAVKMNKELKAPIGIFHTSCGGSTAKDWTPNPKLADQFPFDQDVAKATHQFGVLYQSRLHGAVGFTIRGVVWYQGEDDGRNANYRQDFTDLIEYVMRRERFPVTLEVVLAQRAGVFVRLVEPGIHHPLADLMRDCGHFRPGSPVLGILTGYPALRRGPAIPIGARTDDAAQAGFKIIAVRPRLAVLAAVEPA
jgi:sialate O-acetylesterase